MNRDRIFAAMATIAVLTGIALGFRELGPPRRQRAVQADAERTGDLTVLSNMVNNFYRQNQKLPANLAELKKRYPSVRIADPETNAPYTYSVVGELQYQLCATFATDNAKDPDTVRVFVHPAGTFCNPYVVDKRLY
jgi:hypothetical protein